MPAVCKPLECTPGRATALPDQLRPAPAVDEQVVERDSPQQLTIASPLREPGEVTQGGEQEMREARPLDIEIVLGLPGEREVGHRLRAQARGPHRAPDDRPGAAGDPHGADPGLLECPCHADQGDAALGSISPPAGNFERLTLAAHALRRPALSASSRCCRTWPTPVRIGPPGPRASGWNGRASCCARAGLARLHMSMSKARRGGWRDRDPWPVHGHSLACSALRGRTADVDH